MLPTKTWSQYEHAIRGVGERRGSIDASDAAVLKAMGFLQAGTDELSQRGAAYFHERFIRGDEKRSTEILADTLLRYPPSAAVLQLLDGVPGANRDRVETVLRSQGMGDALTDRTIGALLMMMNTAGVIRYEKRSTAVRVLARPAQLLATPSDAFITPKTPYGNKIWLRRALDGCEGFIYWLDKHFMPQAFELLWEVADGNRIREIRILSLLLPEHQGKALRQLKDLRTELQTKSVDLEWRTIDSKEVRDTHDRWIIGQNTAWNVPNVNAIYSGQTSEILESSRHVELRSLFEGYWCNAVPLAPTIVTAV